MNTKYSYQRNVVIIYFYIENIALYSAIVVSFKICCCHVRLKGYSLIHSN